MNIILRKYYIFGNIFVSHSKGALYLMFVLYFVIVRRRLYLTQTAISTQVHTFPMESFVGF